MEHEALGCVGEMRLDHVAPQADHLGRLVHQGAGTAVGFACRGAADLETRLLQNLEGGDQNAFHLLGGQDFRSEEGRVGEEGRSRWWPDHLKKKNEISRRLTPFSTTIDLLGLPVASAGVDHVSVCDSFLVRSRDVSPSSGGTYSVEDDRRQVIA